MKVPFQANKRSLDMKKMNSSLSFGMLFFLVMCVLLGSVFAKKNTEKKPYTYVAADYSQLVSLKKGQVQILPQKFLREYDPVTFFLKSNVGKKGGTPENYANKFVSISPKHPGEYIWLDSKTLEFRPTVAWPPIQEFKIKMGGSNKKLSTLLAPPIRTLPANGSTDLSPVEFVKLHFSYKVPVAKLQKLIKFEVCPLPGLDKKLCNYITSADYDIKEQIQNSAGEFPYTFKFKQKIKLGQKVKIWVRLSDQEGLSDGVRSYSFETKEEFRLSQVGSYYNKLGINDNGSHYPSEQSVALGANGQIVLDFTANPQLMSITQIKNFLNFSPSPIELKHSQNGKRITLNVKFEKERLYKLTLNPIKIKDSQNRALKISKKSSLYFYQKGPQEFVRWSKTYGLLERFGPQQIPLNIAGTEGLDLRIYKIDPLSKAFWPFPSSALAVDESELPPGPGEEPELESSIMSPLSSTKAKKHIKMLGAPHYSNVINTKEERLNFFQNLDLKDKLSEISGEGKPGTYLVGIRELNGSTMRHYVKVQVTDLVLTSVESKNEVFFSVTSYKTGKPIEGAEIGLEGIEKSAEKNSNSKFERVWSCETNSKGYCKVSNKELYKKSYTFYSKRVVVEKKGDYVVFETNNNKAPLKFVNNHWSQNNSGWLSWLTNKPYDNKNDLTTKAFIFTERPIYRPSEKVYIKGYVRSLKHGKLKTITSGDYTLHIAGGGKSEYVKVKLNSYGSFSHELQKEKMPTGNYHITVVKDYYSKTHSRTDLNSTSFLVDSYRVPKFEVKVDGPRRVPNDKAFDVNLIAKYYAGGRLNESPIRWKVNAYPHTYNLKGWDGFLLSSDKRYSPRRGFNYEGTQEKQGKTDADGFAKLRINPQESKNANPVKYVYEATVTDVDQQTASDVKSVVSLPPFVLGLKLNRHIRSSKDIAFKLAAIGVDEKALKNQSVHIHLKKMSWVSYLQETDFAKGKPKYVTEENIFTIEERDLKTKSKALEVVFKNQEPGVYILEIDSKDKLGRLQTLKVDLFLAGDKPMSWKKSEDQVFKTVPDKKEYAAGETANILLQSPYQKALALAVLELADGSIKYDWVDIKNGQGNYPVVIQSDMVRRVPVNFLIFRPRLTQPRVMPEGNKIDLGKPESVANTTWLQIKPDANKVEITLDHKMTALPGSQLKINIKLNTPKGKAVPGEVTLWLVDEAVLSLAKESSINPLKHFLVTPNSNITLRDSRNMAMGDLRVRDNPGGDGMFSRMGASESMMGDITVRKNFKTVPFYKSTIKVDKSGQASVQVPLPDNLTNFAIRAVAVSGSSRFGAQKSKIKIRLPVIVQPALPRFVRTGDVFKAGGVARSVEGKGGNSFFSLSTEGLKAVNSKSDSKVQSFVLPDKKPIRLFKTFEASNPGYDSEGQLLKDSIKITMAVRKATDKKGDAFEVKIPLKSDRSFVQKFYSQEMTGDSVLSWKKITEDYRDKTLSRELSLGSNLGIVNAMQALRYQLEYPH
ncbi:MG2 domain-containing protein, partial [Fibrobacterales bacterium]|nr:MG2 domain-containing protein [Fibrobacterales bacterium]